MGGNHTQPKFILLGITDTPWEQAPLFGLFLLIYIVTLAGNIGLIVLVWVAPSLHTPMYFFLTHFSLADVCYSTIISPKMLTDLLFGNKTISWAGCVTQFHLFALFVTAECHLLAAMAYDRLVAVCHPLSYVMVVSPRACWQLVAWSYLVASLSALVYTGCTFGGSFCGPRHIDHFFCDASPVLRLVCSDTRGSEVAIFALATANGLGTSVVILLSYGRILHTVLGMRSAPSRARAFHTCASHLVSVSVFYGTLFFMYLQPASRHGSRDKVASVFYTVVSPMLNPFIYSLRNKEVKVALGKCRRKMLNLCRHQRSAANGIRESWNVFSWKGP
ncbi:olfactory receptor 8J2-like [Poecile atricapillus]|uniref:olfactory receptor 8J2-like n=1 Tax=Poecile atricapillus TaxID=48891 RepID=UPI00273946A1|nr:olfactory receptor 8J2-like [Poecile atricapillus]XP_058685559.1 olfactory receptor 8J2-like [Poecile atricapillus]